MHYDLEKRLDNYDNQLKQVDILRRSQVSGNAEIIKAYEDANRQLETLKKEYEDISIVCTSPSKTFNLASLMMSNIFYPKPWFEA